MYCPEYLYPTGLIGLNTGISEPLTRCTNFCHEVIVILCCFLFLPVMSQNSTVVLVRTKKYPSASQVVATSLMCVKVYK